FLAQTKRAVRLDFLLRSTMKPISSLVALPGTESTRLVGLRPTVLRTEKPPAGKWRPRGRSARSATQPGIFNARPLLLLAALLLLSSPTFARETTRAAFS